MLKDELAKAQFIGLINKGLPVFIEDGFGYDGDLEEFGDLVPGKPAYFPEGSEEPHWNHNELNPKGRVMILHVWKGHRHCREDGRQFYICGPGNECAQVLNQVWQKKVVQNK